MHPYLHRLGIRPEAQSFFKPYHQNLVFKYGSRDYENCSGAAHKIPQTDEVWMAGEPALATDIFICGSAMDAICFLHFHYHLFNYPEQLLFVSVGASPSKTQIQKIDVGRYHLLFSRDILGQICDIKVATWLRNQPGRIELGLKNKLKLYFRSNDYLIDQKLFTLNRIERMTGCRFNVTTHKPKYQNTFFEQLKYGHPT
jgi:hypothetical protein